MIQQGKYMRTEVCLMSNVSTILADVRSLSNNEKEELFNAIGEILTISSYSNNLTQEVRESRFSKGKICPHCTSEIVVRNGKYKGKQRYICKTCKKTFSDFTYSPVAHSKKPMDKWLAYAKCMIMGYSVRKSADAVDINSATAFFWRHKILEAVKKYMGFGSVDGIIKADETFFSISFKGNHKKSKTFTMPREPHKRGKKAEKRGISKEKVCVACAIDRAGNIIMDLICLGIMTSKQLEGFYGGHIGDSSIFCTDSHKSYVKFTQNFELDHKRVKSGYYKEGAYHIQHINSLHSKLKKWIKDFNGVSTKYLSNYLYWFKWLQFFNEDKEIVKSKNFLVHSNSNFVKINIDNLKSKAPIPVK